MHALKASGTDTAVDASGAQGERTAHTVLGGMDPVATFTQYAARVGFVHMKGIAARRNPGEPWSRRLRELGDLIVHVYVHDYDGTHDHVELDSGQVDVNDLLRSAAEVGYAGTLCLELKPDRVSSASILRSRDFSRAQMARLGLSRDGRPKSHRPTTGHQPVRNSTWGISN